MHVTLRYTMTTTMADVVKKIIDIGLAIKEAVQTNRTKGYLGTDLDENLGGQKFKLTKRHEATCLQISIVQMHIMTLDQH